MSSKYRTRANELYNIINNPEATKEAKTKAHAELKKLIDELNEYASNYAAQIRNTYKTKVASKSDLHISQITYAQFEKAMKIDLSDDPASARASINAQYNQYKSKLAEYGDNNVMGQVALKKRYEDVIAIYTMLEIFTDEELTQLGQLMQKEEQARQTAQAIEKMSNRTSKTVSKLETTSATSTTASHETSKAVEGSIR
jgi:hypothetical protein